MHKQKKVNGSSKVRFRKVPESEGLVINELAEHMHESWRVGRAFSALADKFIYGHTFMGIKNLPKFFSEVLGDSILLDLGAGDPKPMVDFALCCDVKLYLAVDLYCPYGDMDFKDPRIVLENDDMLRYVAKMPDNSANVFLGAIDDIVLMNPKSIEVELSYRSLLLNQICRVVPPGGIVFGVNSHIFSRLEQMGFERIAQIGRYKVSIDPETAVLQKRE